MAGHRRNSLRLHGYDYASAGAYFVTVCSADRVPLFGEIKDDRVVLTPFGHIVSDRWHQAVTQVHGSEPDEFIVMADHFHAIVWLNTGVTTSSQNTVGANDYPPFASHRAHLRSLVRTFKAAVTTAINTERNTPGNKVWQRNYYDRVIRDERELNSARKYVRFNVDKCLMMRETSARR
ncbi:MAG: transposase [Chloroflexi bacterium]|jgi:putative transposase|nr:transposase [Chloroflexota bacterium]MBT4074930.1 transposase [Chloroflexota bacterium]MBT4514533.1 transposase [Chloroflexota bacterium]MBT5320126.1 transposase [Chloroflexota bacterium]